MWCAVTPGMKPAIPTSRNTTPKPAAPSWICERLGRFGSGESADMRVILTYAGTRAGVAVKMSPARCAAPPPRGALDFCRWDALGWCLTPPRGPPVRQRLRRSLLVGACGLALVATPPPRARRSAPRPSSPAGPAPQAGPLRRDGAAKRWTTKNATALGTGGAVSSVDPEATHAGIEVLRKGGNAVDAAIATAAALGVTEPYSTGIGGGGYLVYYDARTRKVSTLDGRETAPRSIPRDAFIDPATGQPYPFTPDLVTSGVSVGVPGTAADLAAGAGPLGHAQPPQGAASRPRRSRGRGFVVDDTFREQTLQNKDRFAQVSTTADLYLPGGDAPQVGSVFRNPDLAATYDALGREGTKIIYRGRIGSDIVRTVQNPPKTKDATLPFPHGLPGEVRPRGLPGGQAQADEGRLPRPGRLLDRAVLERRLDRRRGAEHPRHEEAVDGCPAPTALHDYLDASSLAFADRNAYVGDPAFVDVPLKTLLSKPFARSRACQITDRALPTPTQPGALDATGCATAPPSGATTSAPRPRTWSRPTAGATSCRTR